MSKSLILLVLVFMFSVAVSAQTMKVDKSPCDAIKGKTYLGWNAGNFDKSTDAVNSNKIVFDSKGNGTTREFFVLDDTANAQQLKRNVTCKVDNDKKSFLDFGSSAILYITSYDNGSKIWAEAPQIERKTKGWMLQLPPNPTVNIVK